MFGLPLVNIKEETEKKFVELAVAYNKLAPGISAILTAKQENVYDKKEDKARAMRLISENGEKRIELVESNIVKKGRKRGK